MLRTPGLVLTVLALAAAPLLGAVGVSEAQTRPAGAPAEMKVAFVDYFSGPGATFGIVAKNAAEWLVDKWNADGGIRGVRVRLVLVDEAGSPDKQVTEFRRLVLDEKVDAVVGYTSSANCLAIAPVAEQLRALLVPHVCGTHRLNEDMKLKYVFRAGGNTQTADSVIGARYIAAIKPDIKTVAAINFDYAYGRDSWADFKAALLRLKPDVKVVGEVWTKFQATEYSSEISRLLVTRPDVIHTTNWGGGLIAFIQQAAPRGLFRQSLTFFSGGEHVLQDVRREMPDGMIVNARVAGYFLVPDPDKNPLQKEFVDGFKGRFGRYPDLAAYRAYQALAGLRAAFEKAIDQERRWPTTEDVVRTFEGLRWNTPVGPVTMRADHQAVHPQIVGLTKVSSRFGFSILDRVQEYGPDQLMPPVGQKTPDWLRSLK